MITYYAHTFTLYTQEQVKKLPILNSLKKIGIESHNNITVVRKIE